MNWNQTKFGTEKPQRGITYRKVLKLVTACKVIHWEMYWEPLQTSTINLFAQIFNSVYLLVIYYRKCFQLWHFQFFYIVEFVSKFCFQIFLFLILSSTFFSIFSLKFSSSLRLFFEFFSFWIFFFEFCFLLFLLPFGL